MINQTFNNHSSSELYFNEKVSKTNTNEIKFQKISQLEINILVQENQRAQNHLPGISQNGKWCKCKSHNHVISSSHTFTDVHFVQTLPTVRGHWHSAAHFETVFPIVGTIPEVFTLRTYRSSLWEKTIAKKCKEKKIQRKVTIN